MSPGPHLFKLFLWFNALLLLFFCFCTLNFATTNTLSLKFCLTWCVLCMHHTTFYVAPIHLWLLILVEWFKKLLNTFILTLIENVRRSRKELIRTWEERAAVCRESNCTQKASLIMWWLMPLTWFCSMVVYLWRWTTKSEYFKFQSPSTLFCPLFKNVNLRPAHSAKSW